MVDAHLNSVTECWGRGIGSHNVVKSKGKKDSNYLMSIATKPLQHLKIHLGLSVISPLRKMLIEADLIILLS